MGKTHPEIPKFTPKGVIRGPNSPQNGPKCRDFYFFRPPNRPVSSGLTGWAQLSPLACMLYANIASAARQPSLRSLALACVHTVETMDVATAALETGAVSYILTPASGN
jgi:hypothetical protein